MPAQTWKTHWANIDQSGDPQRYVEQMAEIRNQPEDTDISDFLRFCDLQAGARVLDVGCGTGWHVRAASYVVGPTGRAVGVDLSEAMLVKAREQSAARGVDVDLVQASAYSLPFADSNFDCCWTNGVTVVLDDPVQAIREMVRVTRPGGHICLAEHHMEGAFISPGADPLTRRLLRFIYEHGTSHPSGYEMVSILKSLGATIAQVEGILNHTDEVGAARTIWLDEYLTDAQAVGALTAEEARTWLADQEARASEGRFVFGFPAFLIKATKQ
jgi:ubiquinone/menaquinone biosynthesis C-methylase UbiE